MRLVLLLLCLICLLPSCSSPGSSSANNRTKTTVIEVQDVRGLLADGSIAPALKAELQRKGKLKKGNELLEGNPVPAIITITETSSEAQAVTPSNPVTPATVTTGTGGPAASTGAQQEIDHAKVERTRIITWAGVACIVIAGLTLIARAWVPLIPINATLVFGGMGLAFFWLPDIFVNNPLLIGLGVTAVVVMYVIGLVDNKAKLNTPAPSQIPVQVPVVPVQAVQPAVPPMSFVATPVTH